MHSTFQYNSICWTLTSALVMLCKHSLHPCYCNSVHMCFSWCNRLYCKRNIRRCHLQRLKVYFFYLEHLTQAAGLTHAVLVVGKRSCLLSQILSSPELAVKKVASVFSQYRVCYGRGSRAYLRPVMAFPGPRTCPGTTVSKTNAEHRNVALARGNSLANIQSLFSFCFVLSLSSSCPVDLQFCLWFPLWLRWASGSLACFWNRRSFLWVNWSHDVELEAGFCVVCHQGRPSWSVGGWECVGCVN